MVWLCLVVWLLLPGIAVSASDALSRWRPFMALRAHSVATGLQGKRLQHTVTVGEDALGRIWIGDFAGVSLLDGDVQRRFSGRDVPAMAEGYTHAFHALPSGDMLVGGDREGLLRFDHRSERFHPIGLASGERLTRINALTASSAAGVWVASEQGLFHWAAGAASLQRDPASGREAAASPRLFDVQQMDDGTVWVAAQPGLYRRRPGQSQWEPVQVDDARLQQRLRTESAWDLTADEHGRLWVGLMRSGVVLIERDGRASAPQGLDGVTGVHAGRTIRSQLWDPLQQRLLVGTDGAGLVAVRNGQASPLPINLSDFTGGRNFHVRSLRFGRDGKVWAASDRGVFHFDPHPAAVMELDASLPALASYEAPTMVRSLLLDKHGRLWIGQNGGTVQVVDPESGRRTVIALPPPLDGTFISGITRDGHGNVWLVGNGVVLVDEDSLRVRDVGALASEPMRRYMDVATDGQRVWLSHNEGLVEMDPLGRVTRRMDSSAQGLRSTRLNALSYRDGTLWVGSAAGLHAVDLTAWRARWVPWSQQTAGMYRLTSSVLATDRGVWTGTAHGLSRTGTGGHDRLDKVLGSGGRDVRALADDGQGGVWFSQDGQPARIGRFDRDGTVTWLPPRRGMHPGTVLHARAMALTADGVLLTGTETGVLMVDAALVGQAMDERPDLSPKVLAIRIDGQSHPVPRVGDGEPTLHLAHDAERLEVVFSSRDYTGASLRHYSYWLEGMDSRWIDVPDATPRVFYSRLPPGRYTLLLRATSDEYPGMVWITRVALVVAPAWYRKTGYVLLLGAGLTLLGWALLQWRFRRARRYQAQLEATVAARTDQLQQANARLARLASEDVLTGLDNRRRGMEKLAARQAYRRQVPGTDALLLIDLDYFKTINDTHGHLAGDAVLREVARRLRACLRGEDVAVRHGGEELFVLLPDTTLHTARLVAERLLLALRESPVVYGDVAIAVSASIGVAPLLSGTTVELVLAHADAALYRAKASGRDRVCVTDRVKD